MTTPEQEEARWTRLAKRDAHHAICSMQPWTDETHNAYLDIIEPRLTFGAGPVLDLGCGVGRLLIPLAQRHPDQEFRGVDISEEMLRRAQANVEAAGTENVELALGDGRTLPFADGSLGCVFSIIVLQHIPIEGVRVLLAEIARCLKPGGTTVLQYVSSGPPSRDWAHVFPDPVFAEALAQAGLTRTACDSVDMYAVWSVVQAQK